MLSAFSETIRLNTLGIGSGKGLLADNANTHGTGAGTETGAGTGTGTGTDTRNRNVFGLSLGLHNDSPLQKDNKKIALCDNQDLDRFVAHSPSDVKNVYGDIGGKDSHQAFYKVGNVAMLCNNCHAVLCTKCFPD